MGPWPLLGLSCLSSFPLPCAQWRVLHYQCPKWSLRNSHLHPAPLGVGVCSLYLSLSVSHLFYFQGGETERKRPSPLLGWCRVIRDLASQCLTASQYREGIHVRALTGGTTSIALLQAYRFLEKHRGGKCHSPCPPRGSDGYGRGTVSLSLWVTLFHVDDGTVPKCHHLRTLLGACLLKQTLNHKHSLWQRPEAFPGSQWFWCLQKLHNLCLRAWVLDQNHLDSNPNFGKVD